VKSPGWDSDRLGEAGSVSMMKGNQNADRKGQRMSSKGTGSPLSEADREEVRRSLGLASDQVVAGSELWVLRVLTALMEGAGYGARIEVENADAMPSRAGALECRAIELLRVSSKAKRIAADEEKSRMYLRFIELSRDLCPLDVEWAEFERLWVFEAYLAGMEAHQVSEEMIKRAVGRKPRGE
jgi:hypothetical protein